MSLLTETQISEELATIPGWTRDGDSIVTVTERADFRDALLYLGAVAYLAETASHHPDITINWNKVTLTLSTHSAGGLTANDFALARQISAPVLRPPPIPPVRAAGRTAAPVRHLFRRSNKTVTIVSPDLNKKTPQSLF